MIYFNHYQNIAHFALLNIFITNGIFLTTRTILHTKLLAPNIWLQLDRFMCLVIFYFYLKDLLELFNTSLYANFRAEKLTPKEKLQIENAKALLSNFGKDFFYKEKDVKDKNGKSKRDHLPERVPLNELTTEEAEGLGYE